MWLGKILVKTTNKEKIMPYSIQLHNSLNKIAIQHKELALKFQEFARFVKDCTQTPSVANHSIVVSLQHLDRGFFTTSFARRTVSFVFSSIIDEKENLQGIVTTYIHSEFPESNQIKFGEFTFDETGHTNIKIPNEDSAINIANDFGTLHIVLFYIRESLLKSNQHSC
jgi:hypothetical protein